MADEYEDRREGLYDMLMPGAAAAGLGGAGYAASRFAKNPNNMGTLVSQMQQVVPNRFQGAASRGLARLGGGSFGTGKAGGAGFGGAARSPVTEPPRRAARMEKVGRIKAAQQGATGVADDLAGQLAGSQVDDAAAAAARRPGLLGKVGLKNPGLVKGLGLPVAGQLAGGLIQGGEEAGSGRGRLAAAARGAGTGAGIGSMFPGAGTAIGAGVGGLLGLLDPEGNVPLLGNLYGAPDSGGFDTQTAMDAIVNSGYADPEKVARAQAVMEILTANGYSEQEAFQQAFAPLIEEIQSGSVAGAPSQDAMAYQAMAAALMQPFVQNMLASAGAQEQISRQYLDKVPGDYRATLEASIPRARALQDFTANAYGLTSQLLPSIYDLESAMQGGGGGQDWDSLAQLVRQSAASGE